MAITQPAFSKKESLSIWLERHFLGVTLTPALLIMVTLTAYPMVSLIYYSLHKWSLTYYQPNWNGLGNFQRLLFQDPGFWHSAKISLLFSVGAVTLEFLLGLGIALLFDRPMKILGLLRSLFILPMVMTPVVTGLVWRVLYSPTFGLINYFTGLLGFAPRAWVDKAATALPALIVVDVWQWTPFMFLMITAGLQSLPSEPFEAAKVDGATRWQTFRYLTIPMLRPVLLVGILLRTIESFKTFDIIFMLTRGGPGTATQTINLYNFYLAFEWLRPGYASALALLALIIIITLGFFMSRLSGLDEGVVA